MDISIIIVNYNGLKHIKPLFDGFCNFSELGFHWEIIFVDNDSKDDSVNYLRENYFHRIPNIKIVQASQNLGFAEGNNEGVKHARGEYIVFLNNDTKVDRNWLIALYETISQNEEIGITVSKLVFFYDFLKLEVKTSTTIELCTEVKINEIPYALENKFCKNVVYGSEKIICFGNSTIYLPILKNGEDFELKLKTSKRLDKEDFFLLAENKYCETSDQELKLSVNKVEAEEKKVTLIQNAGSGMTKRYFGYDVGFGEEDKGQFDEGRYIDYACGASMMLRKEDFLCVGGFDKKYFMYYEDSDLSSKIKRLGKNLYYCPASIVRHLHAASSGEWSDFFIYYITKNRLLFIYKNISRRLFWIELIRELKVGLSVCFRNNPSHSKNIKLKSLKKLLEQIRNQN